MEVGGELGRGSGVSSQNQGVAMTTKQPASKRADGANGREVHGGAGGVWLLALDRIRGLISEVQR